MSSITIEVDVDAPGQKSLLAELFATGGAAPPYTKELALGCQLKFEGFPLQKSAHHGALALRLFLAFLPNVSAGVVSGVVANWLSAKFQNKGVSKIRTITRTFDMQGMEVLKVLEIKTTPENLRKMVTEVLDKDLKSDEFL